MVHGSRRPREFRSCGSCRPREFRAYGSCRPREFRVHSSCRPGERHCRRRGAALPRVAGRAQRAAGGGAAAGAARAPAPGRAPRGGLPSRPGPPLRHPVRGWGSRPTPHLPVLRHAVALRQGLSQQHAAVDCTSASKFRIPKAQLDVYRAALRGPPVTWARFPFPVSCRQDVRPELPDMTGCTFYNASHVRGHWSQTSSCRRGRRCCGLWRPQWRRRRWCRGAAARCSRGAATPPPPSRPAASPSPASPWRTRHPRLQARRRPRPPVSASAIHELRFRDSPTGDACTIGSCRRRCCRLSRHEAKSLFRGCRSHGWSAWHIVWQVLH